MAVVGLLNIVALLIPNNDPAPASVIYGSYAVGALGFIASIGLFAVQRWGKPVASLITVLSIVLGIGSLTQSAPVPLQGLGVALIVLSALSIIFMVLPAGRQISTAQ